MFELNVKGLLQGCPIRMLCEGYGLISGIISEEDGSPSMIDCKRANSSMNGGLILVLSEMSRVAYMRRLRLGRP